MSDQFPSLQSQRITKGISKHLHFRLTLVSYGQKHVIGWQEQGGPINRNCPQPIAWFRQQFETLNPKTKP
jgi:hypothetical protein